MKPLVLFCPPEHYEALVSPILGPLFTYLHMVRDWLGKGNKADSWGAWPLMSQAGAPGSVLSWPCQGGCVALPSLLQWLVQRPQNQTGIIAHEAPAESASAPNLLLPEER